MYFQLLEKHIATSGHQELLTVQSPPRFGVVSNREGHFGRYRGYELGIHFKLISLVSDPAKWGKGSDRGAALTWENIYWAENSGLKWFSIKRQLWKRPNNRTHVSKMYLFQWEKQNPINSKVGNKSYLNGRKLRLIF